jgi:hypothetical protein
MSSLLNNNRGSIGKWIVIFIIVAAAVFGYQYFKKTPRYTLIQFKKCVMFSDAEGTQKYIDLEKVVAGLPESFTNRQPDATVKQRLTNELNSATEKSFFKPIKGWSVITAPITVMENQVVATAIPAEGTKVTLEKTDQELWVITGLEIPE